jgi:hypothetical protein
MEKEKGVRFAELHLGGKIHLVPFASGQVRKDLPIKELDVIVGQVLVDLREEKNDELEEERHQ